MWLVFVSAVRAVKASVFATLIALRARRVQASPAARAAVYFSQQQLSNREGPTRARGARSSALLELKAGELSTQDKKNLAPSAGDSLARRRQKKKMSVRIAGRSYELLFSVDEPERRRGRHPRRRLHHKRAAGVRGGRGPRRRSTSIQETRSFILNQTTCWRRPPRRPSTGWSMELC